MDELTRHELENKELEIEVEELKMNVSELLSRLEEVADRFSAELGLLTPYAKRKWIEG